MNLITPEEAQELLKEPAAYHTVIERMALETIAADTIEYGVETTDEKGETGWMSVVEDWWPWGTYEQAKKKYDECLTDPGPFMENHTYRIIARRVSPTWEVKE